MRLKFFLAIVTGLALLSSTNVSFATCPIYFYNAGCFEKGRRHDLITDSAQLVLDSFDLKNKFTVKAFIQSCRGNPLVNDGDDPPPSNLAVGSVFITEDATPVMDGVKFKGLRYKYILKRSNENGGLMCCLLVTRLKRVQPVP